MAPYNPTERLIPNRLFTMFSPSKRLSAENLLHFNATESRQAMQSAETLNPRHFENLNQPWLPLAPPKAPVPLFKPAPLGANPGSCLPQRQMA